MNQLTGFFLASLIGLGVLTQVLPETAALSTQASANYAAAQLHTFSKASENYINNNYATLVAATAGGVQAVTAPMIVTEGSLDPSFVNTNIFDQTHRLLIRQSTPGSLEGLVATCGGDTIDPNELARISKLGGPDAGLISPLDPNNALGAGGHWTMDLSNYTHASCALEVGHLTSLITASSAADVSPYLHRNAHPDAAANTMFTTLLMDGNDISNTDNLDVNTINNADGNVRINDTLEVTGSISNPSGNVTFNDTVDVQSDLWADRLRDRQNGNYYVDPASVTVLNDVRGAIFRDQNNTGFYLDPNSASILNDVRASIFYDRNNTGYYVDPASTSNTNHMNAQRLYSHGETYSQLYRPTTLFAENSGCSQTYAIAVSTANDVVICKGGTWKRVGSRSLTSALTSIPANSTYSIPTDGFVYVQANTGCTYSYQNITISGVLRGSQKAYAPGGSLSYGTFPVRAGDWIRVDNTFGCNPSFIYYQRYG